MSKSTWTGAVSSDWDDAGQLEPGWRTGRKLGRHNSQRDAGRFASASIGTVNSITDSSDLRFESAGTNTVTTFLDNTGPCTSTLRRARAERSSTSGGR